MGEIVEMEAKYLVILVIITSFMLREHNVTAKELIVGDNDGWKVPSTPTTYSDWASKHNFSVGDVLVFNFASGSHTVALVNQSAYETCNTSNTISVISQGPARVPIEKMGPLHFFCTIDGHCLSGLKLAINVTNNSSSAPISSTSHKSIVNSSYFALFLLVSGFFFINF